MLWDRGRESERNIHTAQPKQNYEQQKTHILLFIAPKPILRPCQREGKEVGDQLGLKAWEERDHTDDWAEEGSQRGEASPQKYLFCAC